MQNIPLAERLRPKTLDEFEGQQHLVGEEKVLRKMIETGNPSSMILWGPPGVGKTTLANIIAGATNIPFVALSAISSGVKDVKQVIETAGKSGKILLFIDEIHRFNKAQQDSLLGAVEKGKIILIGATTENPSFEVISALLSRCHVYILKEFSKIELEALLNKALKTDVVLSKRSIVLQEIEAIIRFSGGDARKLLNIVELVCDSEDANELIITDALVMEVLQTKTALYDKQGEMHYDIISAFIKSIRGSDPNAAVYYLTRMMEGGEDPKFIARRLLILASEDIGNANPNALLLATACFQAVNMVGYPECSLTLSQTTIYLATSVKSNSAYAALQTAKKIYRETGDLSVPLHLRNAPTSLMKKMDYGKDYKYAHSYDNNFIEQEFLPEEIKAKTIYEPGKNPKENEIRNFLKERWKGKYGY
ncbi:MAG: replication-associated recombination protein A [Bacteroidetes bacterium]|nr:replication-associated recombination protein A [Bacteroidota bacterium]